MMGAEPTIEHGEGAMAAVALRVIDGAADQMPLALDLSPDTSFDEWQRIGRRLCLGAQAVNWHIGDWWAFGDHHYGERAEKAAEGIFGLSFGTLRNLGSIARRFEVSRRRDVVPFTADVEVAALPDDKADELLDRTEREHLSTRDLRRVVQELKASNDTDRGEAPTPAQRAAPKPERTDLEEAYTRIIEFADAIEHFRPLDRREADFVAKALEHLGEAHAERRPVPDDFDVVFVEQGRVACETWYRASRLTENRWLIQRGKRRLIEERANFVKHQRNMAHQPKPAGQPVSQEIDTYMPVARMAADFLRIRRNGGWMISMCDSGGWRVGTVQRTSEQLIAMAVNQGFDRDAAVAEARAEGY
jgi:hypothetical protein